MESFNEVVNLVKEQIKEQISDIAYNVWINVIEPVKFEGNKAVLYIKTPFQRDVLLKQYLSKIEDAFEAVLGFPVEVLIITENEINSYIKEDEPQESLSASFIEPEKTPDILPVNSGMDHMEDAAGDNSGNYEYTFDTFIVGPSNNFAYAACKAITTDNQIGSAKRTYCPQLRTRSRKITRSATSSR